MQTLASSGTLEIAHQISGTIHDVIASAAVIIGAVWAYFRFVRFRTLRPRLEFSFEWSRSDMDDSHSVAILTAKLTNKGQTKVQLRKDKNPRCFLKYALIPESRSAGTVMLLNIPPNGLEHIDAAFVPHRWIEPGETIDDAKVLNIDRTRLLAIQFELVLFGLKKWSAVAAFPLIGEGVSQNSKSEDEQDEYEEVEALRESLRNVLARIQRLKNQNLEKLEIQIDALLKSPVTGGSFVSQAKLLVDEGEEGLRSIV